ncbi:MAG: hypothetical protein IKZ49_01930 [Alphaproteobacteria bacterium]|nr:hypothetical protein [Alphaproteobacteria bacterium]
MKKTIMLPSLFVLNSFLVGLIPKTSNAGNVQRIPDKDIDSISTTLVVDSGDFRLNFDMPVFGPEYVKFYKLDSVYLFPPISSVKNELPNKYVFNILPVGNGVKYVSEDGSGFIRSQGSRTWRNMNPGAIRYGEFTKQYGACGKAGGFAVFPTEEHGMKALKGLLCSDKYKGLTIAAAIYKWAPPSDNNNTKAYQRHLSKITGLSLTRKLNQLTPAELEKVANAIKFLEGWKIGKEEFFENDNVISMTNPNIKNMINYQNMIQRQYNG